MCIPGQVTSSERRPSSASSSVPLVQCLPKNPLAAVEIAKLSAMPRLFCVIPLQGLRGHKIGKPEKMERLGEKGEKGD